MLFWFYFLFMLRVGQCTDDKFFETQTVEVGKDVTLTCPRQASGVLLWVKFVSENAPIIITTSNNLQDGGSRITDKREPGKYLLNITKAKLSDSAVYSCMKIHQQKLVFLHGINLKVEDLQEPRPDSEITAAPPSDPVRPGDSVTLQCSVLAVNNTCLQEHDVFSARLDKYLPGFIYTRGKRGEKSLDAGLLQKCVSNFSRDVNTSDADGIYHCAVTTCGQTLSQNETKGDNEVLTVQTEDLQNNNNTIVILLCAALTLSLMVIVFLLYSIKKMKKTPCDCSKVDLHTKAAASDVQQTDEDSLVYSAPTFMRKKSSKSETRDIKTEENEIIYSSVNIQELD